METITQPQTHSSTSNSSKKRKLRAEESSENSGEDGKKRGRPKTTERSSESTADRRRTQIRMAQRAYRQRKESTLEELRKRVNELTNTAELMNKAWLDYQDKLVSANLTESQLLEVRETAAQYDSLMKLVRNPGDGTQPSSTVPTVPYQRESTESDIGVDVPPVAQSNTPRALPQPSHLDDWVDASTIGLSKRQDRHGPFPVALGYTIYEPHVNNEFFTHFEPHRAAGEGQNVQPQQQHSQQSFDVFHVEVPDYTIPASLPAPASYAFRELSFARRLHRTTMEAAYKLLVDQYALPKSYDRVFRLSLMSRTHDKMLDAIKSCLSRDSRESLDIADSVLIHVGGAGTHFARKDHYGNIIPKKESWNLGVIGPQTLALLEDASKENPTIDMTVDIAGFEGEWYDPYDVEGYLAERGIHIDPTSSFVQAELPLQPPTLTSETSSCGTASSCRSADSPPHAFEREQSQTTHLSFMDVDATSWNAAAPATAISRLSEVGYSDAETGSWMNLLQPREKLKTHMPLHNWQDVAAVANSKMDYCVADKNAPMNAYARKSVMIDVAKFAKALITTAVCLGRTPGFRRKDVDRALTLASFDAFS